MCASLDAASFFQVVYQDQIGYLCLFSGRREDKPSDQKPKLLDTDHQFFPYPADIDSAIQEVDLQTKSGREVYCCAHLLTERKRTKGFAAPLMSLYADLDHTTLLDDVPHPTVIVESSPGKWQCWWALTEPLDPTVGESLNQSLTYAAQADKSGWDLSQVLRVPSSLNHKYDHDNGGQPPHPVDVVDFDPDRRYTASDFDGLPDPPTPLVVGAVTPNWAEMPDPDDVWEKYRLVMPRELKDLLKSTARDRSGSLFRIYHLCRDMGASEDEAFSLIYATAADKFYHDGRKPKDLWDDIHRGYQRVAEDDDSDDDDEVDDGVAVFQAYRRSELKAIKPPTYLIKDILLDDCITGASGVEGIYKSFWALSLACCIVTGTPWYGHEVKRPGSVVYIAGEGVGGVHKRIRAWEIHNGVEVGDDLVVITQSMNLVDRRDQDKVISTVEHLLGDTRPVLIIADTLARTTLGEAENDNPAMSLYLEALSRIRTVAGDHACALFLHHDSDAGKAFRGASSLRGNSEVTIHITPEQGGGNVVTYKKFKDYANPDPLRFRPMVVPNADDSPYLDDDDDRSSVVLIPNTTFNLAAVQSPETLALVALRAFGDAGAKYTTWMKKATEGERMSLASFKRALGSLKADGRVILEDGVYYEVPEQRSEAA